MKDMPPQEEWLERMSGYIDEQPTEHQELRRSVQIFIGLAIGLIPMLIVFIAHNPTLIGLVILSRPYGGLNLAISILLCASVAYITEIVIMTKLLSKKRVRFIGYVLLAMVLITPVVAFIIFDVS